MSRSTVSTPIESDYHLTIEVKVPIQSTYKTKKKGEKRESSREIKNPSQH